jgi:uncharacterized 2Fe-2S/4Fe-4S cluster protein (DUF4445 family)
MQAARGAIEHVKITGKGIHYQTIDDAPPLGICGSGVLDAAAQLYLAGILNEDGRMSNNHIRVRFRGNQREFVLVNEDECKNSSPIVITQQDVRELQLAKAAIRAGIHVLLDMRGRSEEDIEQVIIAGAFGGDNDVAIARAVDMLPPLKPERFIQVGNAAGQGARLALISSSERVEAQAIASKVGYIELAGTPAFKHTFINAISLGTYRIP